MYVHLRQSLKISGGNVDEEDGGYLKIGEVHIIINIYIALFFEIIQSAVYRNWEDGKIEGLVTLVQSNMKLEEPYACWKNCCCISNHYLIACTILNLIKINHNIL